MISRTSDISVTTDIKLSGMDKNKRSARSNFPPYSSFAPSVKGNNRIK